MAQVYLSTRGEDRKPFEVRLPGNEDVNEKGRTANVMGCESIPVALYIACTLAHNQSANRILVDTATKSFCWIGEEGDVASVTISEEGLVQETLTDVLVRHQLDTREKLQAALSAEYVRRESMRKVLDAVGL